MENPSGLQFRSNNLADRYIVDPHKPRRPVVNSGSQIVEQAVPIAQRVLNIESQRDQSTHTPTSWLEPAVPVRQRGIQAQHEHNKQERRKFALPKISFKTMGAVAAGIVLAFGFITLMTGLKAARPPVEKAEAVAVKTVDPIKIEPITAVAGATTDGEVVKPEDKKGVGPIGEDKPSDTVINRYATTASHTRYISIPAVGVTKARVMRSGVANDGSIELPTNIWDAGWYESSALPTDKQGSVLIIGHIKGETSPGLFYDLYRIKVDDVISMTLGDGTIVKYRVIAKEDVLSDNIDQNGILKSRDTSNASLTLLTAIGELNPTTGVYEKRQAVFAIRTN